MIYSLYTPAGKKQTNKQTIKADESVVFLVPIEECQSYGINAMAKEKEVVFHLEWCEVEERFSPYWDGDK